MKSKLFESLNDRSNIINAYMSMIKESIDNTTAADDTVADNTVTENPTDIVAKSKSMEKPVLIYNDSNDDEVIDLKDFEAQHTAHSSDCETGSDEYYVNLAFERMGIDKIYDELLQNDYGIDDEYEDGTAIHSYKDLYKDIVDISREYFDYDIHGDDISVKVPEWAISYLVNNDDSGLNFEEKELVDNWEKEFTDEGYEFVYDGADEGFVKYPAFGDACDCVRAYFRKTGSTSTENDDEEDEEKPFGESVAVEDVSESYCNDSSYFFAVLKDSNKILFAWDEDCSDRDLMIRDLIDGYSVEEFTSPSDVIKRVRFLTRPKLAKYGIDPNKAEYWLEDDYKPEHEGSVDECGDKVDDSLTMKDIKQLKKENPNIKMIAEENGDEAEDVYSDVDDNGIVHEYPKTSHAVSKFNPKFKINSEGASKFDDLTEMLHDALEGCTKGMFADEDYKVVQTVMNKLESIGLSTTITKVENYGIRQSDGLRQGKKYHFDATWMNQNDKPMMVHGIITIAFAGTIENPEAQYDACVHFFIDDDKYIRVKC